MNEQENKKETFYDAKKGGDILNETRKEQAKLMAEIFGTRENLHRFQKFVLPQIDPNKVIKGQADPFAKVVVDGVPMDYIGTQFAVLKSANEKLYAIFDAIEKAFDPENEHVGSKPLRK